MLPDAPFYPAPPSPQDIHLLMPFPCTASLAWAGVCSEPLGPATAVLSGNHTVCPAYQATLASRRAQPGADYVNPRQQQHHLLLLLCLSTQGLWWAICQGWLELRLYLCISAPSRQHHENLGDPAWPAHQQRCSVSHNAKPSRRSEGPQRGHSPVFVSSLSLLQACSCQTIKQQKW